MRASERSKSMVSRGIKRCGDKLKNRTKTEEDGKESLCKGEHGEEGEEVMSAVSH